MCSRQQRFSLLLQHHRTSCAHHRPSASPEAAYAHPVRFLLSSSDFTPSSDNWYDIYATAASSMDEATRAQLIQQAGQQRREQMLPFVHELLPAILPGISHDQTGTAE